MNLMSPCQCGWESVARPNLRVWPIGPSRSCRLMMIACAGNAPCERRGTYQHLNRIVSKVLLDKATVLARHPSMMHSKAERHQVPQIPVLDVIGFFGQDSWTTESGLTNWVIISFSMARSRRNLAVLTISLRKWTNKVFDSCRYGRAPFHSRLHSWLDISWWFSSRSWWRQWIVVGEHTGDMMRQSRISLWIDQRRERWRRSDSWVKSPISQRGGHSLKSAPWVNIIIWLRRWSIIIRSFPVRPKRGSSNSIAH